MNTQELKGKLTFISNWKPVMFISKEDNGKSDLRDYYFKFFESINGKKTILEHPSMNSIEIKLDETSDMVMRFEKDKEGLLILLEKENGEFGMSNIEAYLSSMLQTLNGRSIIVSITDASIKICPDPEEEVFNLYYTRDNNCLIPADKVIPICKPSTNDCCIFLCAGAEGFECMKFNSPSARYLLHRHSEGKMNATRIGNCGILGRKDMPEIITNI